ncbi:hypothetical protein [Azospirillum brasilense]|uniref:hypothetical protein n=1 Tax=Azospirillum brasilense TaxID=192 RepID=UPI001EDAF5E3|nr:hypothetical protein [Azospirillum brasilense]UKJ77289.1 hypothetical protein H1Q64_27015 [Azospirillum brasilense]
MAKRDDNHSTGDRADLRTQAEFVELGYACNPISKDYGEDFFVVMHDKVSKIIEPFRIFVQSKGTTIPEDVPSDWTEYIDPLTVRQWILGSDLVVVVRRNIETREARYTIPEIDYSYWDIYSHCTGGKDVPIRCRIPFEASTPHELVWHARVRHYMRLFALTLKDESEWKDVPGYKLYLLELFLRMGLLSEDESYHFLKGR